jgi:hypothetical protein
MGRKVILLLYVIHGSAETETENLVTPPFQNGNASLTRVTEYFRRPGNP